MTAICCRLSMQGSRANQFESKTLSEPHRRHRSRPHPGIPELSKAEGLVTRDFRNQKTQDEGKQQDLSRSRPSHPGTRPCLYMLHCPISQQSPRPAGPQPPSTSTQADRDQSQVRNPAASDQRAASHRPPPATPHSLTSLLPQAQPRASGLTWPALPSLTTGGGDYGREPMGCRLRRPDTPPPATTLSLGRAHARPRPRPRTVTAAGEAEHSSAAARAGSYCRDAPQLGISLRESRLEEPAWRCRCSVSRSPVSSLPLCCF